MNERDIFLAAIEIADPAERAAYLDQACADNAELRTQVEELLITHAETSQFLETPAVATDSAVDRTILTGSSDTDDDPVTERASGEAEFRKYLEPATRPGWLGRLAHYEIEEILGRGAFGIVAKAFDEKLHRVVAIKLMSPEIASTSPPRKRFLREARTAAAVTHENIVAIHAVEEEPIPYLVMEYIPGRTLQEQMDGHGPLEVPEVLRIGQQVAAGLAAAHAAHLIHRDIKPSNILLSDGPNSRVKISDFGLARAVDDATMTSSGLIAGTPMYMAPEQARGETLDHRADLFSLGSVLYQMAGGRPPFRAANTVAVLKRVCEDTPRPLDDVLPGTPGWLETIIFKLLEKERDDRYQTAQEVADLLARCQRELEHNGQVTCVAVAAVIGLVLMNGGKEKPDPDATPMDQTIAEVEGDQLARGQPIDLITLIDKERDFLDDQLRLQNGKIVTPKFHGVPGSVGMIPYGLPTDYDVELQLQRVSNAGAGFNVGILVGGRQVLVGMDCGRGQQFAWGLDFLDGKPGYHPDNPTSNPGRRLLIGETSDVTIQVRENHVTAVLEGETVIDWTGDPQRLSLWDGYKISRSDSLFFVSQADFIVHKMELIPRGISVTEETTTWHGWPADAPPTALAPFDAEQAKAHQEAWANHLGVPVEYENSIGMKFRLIPPGEFLMGSTPGEIEAALKAAGENQDWRERINSEAPQHKVVFTQPVYVGVTEVTQAQYEQVLGTNPSHFSATGEGKDLVANLETGNHPVETVSWNDAAEFCAKLSQQEKLKPFYFRSGETITPLDGTGYRLPSEAGEYACRAGTTTRFWSGDADQDLISAGWFGGNSGARTHAAGELKANPFGLSDVHGNVWEWVQDSWDPAFYGKFEENAAVDPFIPFSAGSQRVIRGGNWNYTPSHFRSSDRFANAPSHRNVNLGFRVVLVAESVRVRRP